MLREDEDFSLDPFRLKEALFRARAEKQPYDILFLCNPNNPTGLPVKKEIVEEIGVVCKETGTWLAVDECFCDFLDEPEAYSVIPKLKDLDHVIVLKAFTKIYAMAGLRLGYCLSDDRALLAAMAEEGPPWPVSQLAQQAGISALQYAPDWPFRVHQQLEEERRYLSQELSRLRFHVYPSDSNFLLFQGEEGLAGAPAGPGHPDPELRRLPGAGSWLLPRLRQEPRGK